MTTSLNPIVIVTMGGAGTRFTSAGQTVPKPFVPILGKPALYWLLKCFPSTWNIYLAASEVNANYFKNHYIAEPVACSFIGSDRQAFQNLKVVQIQPTPRGPLDTVLQALHIIEEEIEQDSKQMDAADICQSGNLSIGARERSENSPVMVSYCDFAMYWNPEEFLEKMQKLECDAGIVSYKGFHPTYFGPNSYCHLKTDGSGTRVLELQEKQLFGDDIEKEWTSAGLYYFKNLSILKHGLQLQESQNLKHSGGEFYTSLCVKVLIQMGLQVGNFEISHFFQFGTPEDIERIQFWDVYFTPLNSSKFKKFEFKYNRLPQQPTQLSKELFERELVYWKQFFAF